MLKNSLFLFKPKSIIMKNILYIFLLLTIVSCKKEEPLKSSSSSTTTTPLEGSWSIDANAYEILDISDGGTCSLNFNTFSHGYATWNIVGDSLYRLTSSGANAATPVKFKYLETTSEGAPAMQLYALGTDSLTTTIIYVFSCGGTVHFTVDTSFKSFYIGTEQ